LSPEELFYLTVVCEVVIVVFELLFHDLETTRIIHMPATMHLTSQVCVTAA
jgi:uncharacterized membrane protein